jgi:hypothetical protein
LQNKWKPDDKGRDWLGGIFHLYPFLQLLEKVFPSFRLLHKYGQVKFTDTDMADSLSETPKADSKRGYRRFLGGFLHPRGNHFVGLLVDREKKTAEYFNNFGESRDCYRLPEQIRTILEASGVVDKVLEARMTHQTGGIECVVYVCFYLKERLLNATYGEPWGSSFEDFEKVRVPDESMAVERKRLFVRIGDQAPMPPPPRSPGEIRRADKEMKQGRRRDRSEDSGAKRLKSAGAASGPASTGAESSKGKEKVAEPDWDDIPYNPVPVPPLSARGTIEVGATSGAANTGAAKGATETTGTGATNGTASTGAARGTTEIGATSGAANTPAAKAATETTGTAGTAAAYGAANTGAAKGTGPTNAIIGAANGTTEIGTTSGAANTGTGATNGAANTGATNGTGSTGAATGTIEIGATNGAANTGAAKGATETTGDAATDEAPSTPEATEQSSKRAAPGITKYKVPSLAWIRAHKYRREDTPRKRPRPNGGYWDHQYFGPSSDEKTVRKFVSWDTLVKDFRARGIPLTCSVIDSAEFEQLQKDAKKRNKSLKKYLTEEGDWPSPEYLEQVTKMYKVAREQWPHPQELPLGWLRVLEEQQKQQALGDANMQPGILPAEGAVATTGVTGTGATTGATGTGVAEGATVNGATNGAASTGAGEGATGTGATTGATGTSVAEGATVNGATNGAASPGAGEGATGTGATTGATGTSVAEGATVNGATGAASTGAGEGATGTGATTGVTGTGATTGATGNGVAEGATVNGATNGAASTGAGEGATGTGATTGATGTGVAEGATVNGATGAASTGAGEGATGTGATTGATGTSVAEGATVNGATGAASTGAGEGATGTRATTGAASTGAAERATEAVWAIGAASTRSAKRATGNGATIGATSIGARKGGSGAEPSASTTEGEDGDTTELLAGLQTTDSEHEEDDAHYTGVEVDTSDNESVTEGAGDEAGGALIDDLEDRETTKRRLHKANLIWKCAEAHFAKDEYDEAEAKYREGVSFLNGATDAKSVLLAVYMYDGLGNSLVSQGMYLAAETAFRESMARLEGVGKDQRDADFEASYTDTLHNLGDMLQEKAYWLTSAKERRELLKEACSFLERAKTRLRGSRRKNEIICNLTAMRLAAAEAVEGDWTSCDVICGKTLGVLSVKGTSCVIRCTGSFNDEGMWKDHGTCGESRFSCGPQLLLPKL